MSEMADWINELHNRLASTPDPLVGPQFPADGTPAPTTPPDTPAPTTPVDTPALPTTLRDWLLQQHGGSNVLDDAQYDYFKGDEVLRQIQQFDPNARWTTTDIGGGEGGSQGRGRRLDFDVTKLPGVGGPGRGASIYDTGFVPVYDNSNLHNPDMVYSDALYGNLTPYRNVVKPKDPWWTYAAPLAVSLVAPYAAAGLAAAGIGGAAGLTAGVTGSGLAAGAAAPWWATSATKAIPAIGRTATGLTTSAPSVGPHPVAPVQFDPTAFNSGGSAAKPTNNDSSLVATQFAADPYGFSGQQ